jgi:L-lysine 6-transaminase
MVRSNYNMEIIEGENLFENATRVGGRFVEELRALAEDQPIISAVRGRGMMIAFDLPNREAREEFYHGLYDAGLLGIRSGERAIRFRPVLDFPEDAVNEALDILKRQCRRMSASPRATAKEPELVK